MTNNIHKTAIVSPEAKLGDNVKVGAYSVVHANVELGDGTEIGSYCEIGIQTSLGSGAPLKIGKNSVIRSHSVFYESSSFGDQLVTVHRVTVRENTLAGKNLQIGTLGDIQGDCVIGDYVRFHSNVHIGKGSKLGSFIWIFPYVVLTNDPHPPSEVRQAVEVEDYAVIATMSVILPGVKIGKGALIGAGSSVRNDAEPDTVYAGFPAEPICPTKKIKLKDGSGELAYPWTRHFTRGYPEEIVAEWISQIKGN